MTDSRFQTASSQQSPSGDAVTRRSNPAVAFEGTQGARCQKGDLVDGAWSDTRFGNDFGLDDWLMETEVMSKHTYDNDH